MEYCRGIEKGESPAGMAKREKKLKKNWNFFECAYLYLLKNDPDFIEPYIKRYSKGEFTNDELNLNKDINAAYIQKLAQYVNVQ